LRPTKAYESFGKPSHLSIEKEASNIDYSDLIAQFAARNSRSWIPCRQRSPDNWDIHKSKL